MKLTPKALFRADASPAIGGGHLVRCYALACELASHGWEVLLATREASLEIVPFLNWSQFSVLVLDGPPADEINAIKQKLTHTDLLILDHYKRDIAYEKECRSLCRLLLALDDLPNRTHDCDLLIDPTLGRCSGEYQSLVPPGCALLCGPKYALLRKQFVQNHPPRPRVQLNRILLMLGASDPLGISEKVLETLKDIPFHLTVDVVGGQSTPPSNPNLRVNFYQQVKDMRPLMEQADLAIGASGSASWERCSVGLPSLLYVVADNQKDICAALDQAGAAIDLGEFDGDSPQMLRETLVKLRTHPTLLEAMGKRAFEVCDGQGAHRVRIRIEERFHDKSRLDREASPLKEQQHPSNTPLASSP